MAKRIGLIESQEEESEEHQDHSVLKLEVICTGDELEMSLEADEGRPGQLTMALLLTLKNMGQVADQVTEQLNRKQRELAEERGRIMAAVATAFAFGAVDGEEESVSSKEKN